MSADPHIITQADTLERRASILAYHSHRRVSHTQSQRITAAVIRCVLSVADLCKRIQSKPNFTRMLTQAFHHSHDRLGGSYEIQVNDDGTVWIEGSFNIDQLRNYLVTVPQPVEL